MINKMAWGGIYDQVGVAAGILQINWKVPHLKMLYDNINWWLYSEAYTCYGKELYRNCRTNFKLC